MKNKLAPTLLLIRGKIMRIIRPKTAPLSRKFGFDRGTPIDRFWIADFLAQHKKDICGRVLEIGDNRYTRKYGSEAVEVSDVLDVKANTEANIIADLSNAPAINDCTYDCIIITHVLGMIPEYQAALKECHRILKPNGVLLVTVSSLSPTQNHSPGLWRFTDRGLNYAVSKVFGSQNVMSKAYGNVFTGQCFWVGMSQEEITSEELQYNDPEYPCIATCRAIKR